MKTNQLDITNFQITSDDLSIVCALLLVAGEAELYEKFHALHDSTILEKDSIPEEEQLPLPFEND